MWLFMHKRLGEAVNEMNVHVSYNTRVHVRYTKLFFQQRVKVNTLAANRKWCRYFVQHANHLIVGASVQSGSHVCECHSSCNLICASDELLHQIRHRSYTLYSINNGVIAINTIPIKLITITIIIIIVINFINTFEISVTFYILYINFISMCINNVSCIIMNTNQLTLWSITLYLILNDTLATLNLICIHFISSSVQLMLLLVPLRFTTRTLVNCTDCYSARLFHRNRRRRCSSSLCHGNVRDIT